MNDVFAPGRREQAVEQFQQDRAAAGLKTLDPRPEQAKPNIPACDWCGTEATGTKTCSRCQCVSYCSAACQKAHWSIKPNGHKLVCDTLQQTAMMQAKTVVASLTTETAPGRDPYVRVANVALLDQSATYNFALEYGLSPALYGCFQYDLQNARRNYTATPYPTSVLHHLVTAVFRGQRISRAGTNTFGAVDGSRVIDYVSHRPDAFEMWMNATMSLVTIPFEDAVWARGRQYHLHVHQAARDSIVMFVLLWLSGRASRAILVGDMDALQQGERLERIAAALRTCLRSCWAHQDNGRDYNAVLDGNLNQVLAMVDIRRREYGIESTDPVKLCQLPKFKKEMYERMAVPMASASIKKGRVVNTEEARMALMRG
jgi:MYND finger